MSGSDIGEVRKEYFSVDQALKAAGDDKSMNPFGNANT